MKQGVDIFIAGCALRDNAPWLIRFFWDAGRSDTPLIAWYQMDADQLCVKKQVIMMVRMYK